MLFEEFWLSWQWWLNLSSCCHGKFPSSPDRQVAFCICATKKLDFTECLIFVGVTRHRHPVSRFHPLFYPPPCFLQLD